MTTETEKQVISETLTIEHLLEGSDLSDDSKSQIAAVFENAVSSTVTQQVDVISEQLRQDFEERLEESIRAEVTAYRSDMVEKLDSYLQTIVETWLEKNKLVIESEAKVALAESFFEKMETMLESVNMKADATQLGALQEQVETNSTLQESYNTLVEEAASLRAELLAKNKNEVIANLTEGMSVNDKTKFKKLAEAVGEVQDIETFQTRISSIKETFWAKPERAEEEEVTETVETGIVEVAQPQSEIERLAAILGQLDD